MSASPSSAPPPPRLGARAPRPASSFHQRLRRWPPLLSPNLWKPLLRVRRPASSSSTASHAVPDHSKTAAPAMFFLRSGDLRLEPAVSVPFWACSTQSLLCLGLAKPRLAGAPPGACVLAKSVTTSCLVHLRSVHGVEDQQLCPPPCASLVACLCHERLVKFVVRLGRPFPSRAQPAGLVSLHSAAALELAKTTTTIDMYPWSATSTPSTTTPW